MNRRRNQSGFSAVELLITLFVAAAFLIAGYQLFNVVIKDGGETRAEAKASNIAYDYLRRYSNAATNPCTSQTALANLPITVQDLVDVSISVNISCPQTDTPTLSKVEAIVTYGDASSTVRYATFVDKSTGATPNPDITDGLIAWWPLNGNGDAAAGGYNLTNTGATPTDGQNGQPNNAYYFNSTTLNPLYVNNFSSAMVGRSAFTITAWVRPPAAPSGHSGILGFRDDAVGGVHLLQLTGTNTVECRMRVNSSTYYQPATAPTITPNTWQLISIVYSGTTLRCFVNNTGSTAVAATWGGFTSTTLPMYIGATHNSDLHDMQNGSIDDVRVYDRALSASEISQLVTGGAK